MSADSELAMLREELETLTKMYPQTLAPQRERIQKLLADTEASCKERDERLRREGIARTAAKVAVAAGANSPTLDYVVFFLNAEALGDDADAKIWLNGIRNIREPEDL